MNQYKIFTGKIRLKNTLSILVVSFILFYLFNFLYKNWCAVSAFDFRLHYNYLVISLILLFVYFLLRAGCWKIILKKMGIVLSMRKSMKVSFLSMMGRYLPGKVWMVVGKIYLSGKEGVPQKEAFSSVVMEIVLEMVTSIFFFFFYLFSVMEQPLLSPKVIYSLGILMVLGGSFLHPKIFYKIINNFLLKWKGEKVKECISYMDIIQLFVFYTIIILCQGGAFYFFVNTICYVPVDKILGLTGSLAVAGVVGTLSVFTPSGLGVREGVLALLLSSYIASPVAVLVALLARLWVTVVEVVCALFSWKL